VILADGLRFAFGTLSVLRVRVTRWDRPAAGAAMLAAPLVGLVLGVLAALLAAAVAAAGGGLLAGAAAVAVLAGLTRGLHLDGIADTADGLGSGKPAEDALRIMKASDIGPFGVLTLVLLLLGQAAALERAFGGGVLRGAVAVLVLAVAGRAALAWGCRRAVPPARPEGLGAAVAGTVPAPAAAAVTAACACAAAALGWWAAGPRGAAAAGAALLIGPACATLLLRRCVRRFGGITGDVLGALVETSGTAALLAAVLLGLH